MSTIGSPTYKLTKELAHILTPLTGQTTYSVKNSRTFVEKILDISNSPTDLMVNFDVTNLFLQVPIHQALKVVNERLTTNQSVHYRTTIPDPQFIQLI